VDYDEAGKHYSKNGYYLILDEELAPANFPKFPLLPSLTA
jgi:hypothetical protein